MHKLPLAPITARAPALLAALACAAWAYAAPASANDHDLFNEFDLPVLDPATNTYGPDGIEIDFAGNVCPDIPAQYVQDAGIDPFYALELYDISINVPATTAIFNCTFDGSITHAQWLGGTMPVPLPATGWPIPLHTENGQLYLHSGLDEGYATLTGIVPLYKKWLWNQTNPPQSLIIPVTAALAAHLGAEKKDQYAAIFVRTGTQGGKSIDTPPTGTWYLTTYPAGNGRRTKFTLSNNGPEPITLASGGIVTGLTPPTQAQCQQTPDCYQLLLDSLNDQGFPEPGAANSPFTPLKLPSQLSPGQSYTFTAPVP
jgi:hypothetical protein